MNSNDCIEQKGIVEEIDNGIARVMVTSLSACASCHAQETCHAGEIASKEIEVFVGNSEFKKGELVNIQMQKSLGLKATFLAYLLPIVIIFVTLLILRGTSLGEGLMAVLSLLVLIPYFIILYLFKNKLSKKFQFSLTKVT